MEGLYSDLEKAAGLLDVTCSREKVWPILTAYADVLPPEAQMAFRVATNGAGLDCCSASLPHDIPAPMLKILSPDAGK